MSVDSLPPLIEAQVEYLLKHSSFSIKVEQAWSRHSSSLHADRITFLIPFCLDWVKWEVIYNVQYPFAAPDVIFGLDDSEFHPLLMINDDQHYYQVNMSGLLDWDSKDPAKLMLLIHEIRNLYLLYHRRRVEQFDDARLTFEISTIFSREGIEVCLQSEPGKAGEVKFSVPLLNMDLNKMVHGCLWKEKQQIHLQAIFPINRKYSSGLCTPRVKLVSTPELEAFFCVDDMKLPSWVDGMCMAEYLPTLEDKLGIEIMAAAASLSARRRFIEALNACFGRPLEADPIFCRKASVLTSSGLFTLLVHFFLPIQFPKQPPVLMLQSSQHFNSQLLPVSRQILDCPWSPRWDMSEMVERLFDFLVAECESFKRYCNNAILSQY